MVTLLDHGSSSGSVSVDASTYRTHRFTLTGTTTLGAPSGLGDGEQVTVVCDSASGTHSLNFDGAYLPNAGLSVAPSGSHFIGIFTKVGGTFFRLP